MQSKRAKLLKKYLSKNDRLNAYLTEIVALYKQKPTHPAIKILVKKQLKALIAFKSLILLHNLLHQNAIDRNLCSSILQGIVFDSRQHFDAVISEKYLNPYRLFLQRRSQINLKEEPKTLQEREVLVFQLINIIKASQMFQQIIYIFGRYFLEQYKFIIDFNIILAKDISKLYAALQEKYPPPHASEFLKEIQLVHEAMYPIYFNNYFFQHLRTFRPKWINTDYKEEKKKTIKKTQETEPRIEESSPIKPKPIIEKIQQMKKTKQKNEQYKQCLDQTAQGSEQKETQKEKDTQDRSFDAISEQFGQDRQQDEQYLVSQFKIDEALCKYKEQKPGLQQIQDFFTQ